MTLGSLVDDDLDRLGNLGILAEEESENGRAVSAHTQQALSNFRNVRGAANRGVPWFEDLVEDSQLGRIRRQKGGHTSADGTMSMEWEVVEWSSADQEGDGLSGKRKIGEVEGPNEMEMTG